MELTYNINKPWQTLDDWQKEYINADGNCFLLTGRQCGKSTAMYLKCAKIALEKAKSDILVIAFTEKQAYELFFKVLNYLETIAPDSIVRGTKKPTKHEIRLKNGSMIRCHASGQNGSGLRGYTLTKIFVDEAAPMSQEVFTAIMPMISVTGGSIDLASTPRGKSGFFYSASLRDDFKKFYVSSENCPRHSKEFLDTQKKTMSQLEYAQEYLAVFLDDLKRIFSDELISKACTLKRPETIAQGREYYLGCDISRLGSDETTFEIIRRADKDHSYQVENIITTKQLTTQTTDRIIDLHKQYAFKKVGIDSSGTGSGVFDQLLRTDGLKSRVFALENATKALDKDGKKHKRVLKEDMIMNLLFMLEKRKLFLLNDDELVLSLKSIQYEYVIKEGRETKFRIFGNYSHITEGIMRAAWLIAQEKGLNLWCSYN
jgi:hypothetical protein